MSVVPFPLSQVTWPAALAWRMRRQLLAPVAGQAAEATDVVDVVARLVAVAAQLDPAFAELGLRTRLAGSTAGGVDRALASGEIVKTFAFRGALHLMTPEQAGVHLALRASSRMWERRSWQQFYLLGPADWPALRSAVAEALASGPLTRAELGAAVARHPRFAHLAHAFTHESGTFLKPLAWLGDLSVGPSRAGTLTLQSLDGNPRWTGLPELEDAGPQAIRAYLRAYAPASEANLRYWLGEGLGVRRTLLARWLDELRDAAAVIDVDVDGDPRLLLAADLEELLAEPHPTTATARLLPRYDQWVLGPGSADTHVVPPELRPAVSRGSDLVVVDGVVAGTWTTEGDAVRLTWGGSALPTGPELRGALGAEVARLSQVLGRSLRTADAVP